MPSVRTCLMLLNLVGLVWANVEPNFGSDFGSNFGTLFGLPDPLDPFSSSTSNSNSVSRPTSNPTSSKPVANADLPDVKAPDLRSESSRAEFGLNPSFGANFDSDYLNSNIQSARNLDAGLGYPSSGRSYPSTNSGRNYPGTSPKYPITNEDPNYSSVNVGLNYPDVNTSPKYPNASPNYVNAGLSYPSPNYNANFAVNPDPSDQHPHNCTINPCLNGFCLLNQSNPLGYACFCKGELTIRIIRLLAMLSNFLISLILSINRLDGFTGFQCQIEYNECKPDYCKNGATCVQEDKRLVCYCRNGYKGW